MKNFRYLDGQDDDDSRGYHSDEDLRINIPKYIVLFVDYGYQEILSSFDLLPIPRKFVDRLPFQAIECSLTNPQPIIQTE